MTFHLHPKTAVVLLQYLKKEITSYSQNLLRRDCEITSKESLGFRIQQHLDSMPSDLALETFDFEAFSFEVLLSVPDKNVTLAALTKWVLQSIASSFSNIVLMKTFRHISEEAPPVDLFFQALHHSKFDNDYKEVLFEFIDFGRKILHEAFSKEEQHECSSGLSKVMAGVLVNTIYGEDSSEDISTYRSHIDIFSSVLSTCFELSDEDFKNKWISKEEPPSLLRKAYNHFKHSSSSSSSSIPRYSNSDRHSLASSSIPTVLPFSPFISPANSPPTSPFLLPPSINIPESSPSLFFSEGKKEKKKEEEKEKEEIMTLFCSIKQEDLFKFEKIILSKKGETENYINSTYTVFKRSFLHVAVLRQKAGFIHLLRELNADVTHQDKHGQTALHYAAKWEEFNADCFNILLSFPNAWEHIETIQDHKGETALDLINRSIFKDQFLFQRPKEKQKMALN